MKENGTNGNGNGNSNAVDVEQLHHVHRAFMLNMSRAAGKPFEESAKDWRVEQIARSRDGLHCQVCNTRLNDYIILVNAKNRNRVIIGCDCYDKLIRYLFTGNVESGLKDRGALVKELKDRTKAVFDETVMGWLTKELAEGRVEADLRPTIESIRDFGFAPNLDDANRLVDFYTSHRKFFIERLVPECRTFRLRWWLPSHITINQVDRVKDIIYRSNQIDALRAKRARVTAVSVAALRSILREAEGMIKFGHQELVITEELEIICERVRDLLSISGSLSFVRFAPADIDELSFWLDGIRPLTWMRTRVYRTSSGEYYMKDVVRLSWLKVVVAKVFGFEDHTKSSIYVAYYSHYFREIMMTAVNADLTDLKFTKLDTPHPTQPGAFIGRYGKKVKIVPVEHVSRGTYVTMQVRKEKHLLVVHAV